MRSFLLRTPVSVWIVLAWAIAVLPHLSVRSFIWEEGNNAELARDMLARGDFLEPAIFGLRYVEKPSLLSWLIAGTARLTGTVDEWSARLPAMLSVLGTALLVQRLTRRYASAPAALFAAGAFMFSPLLLRKLTISEPDTLVTFLSFAAFVVWWDGEALARVRRALDRAGHGQGTAADRLLRTRRGRISGRPASVGGLTRLRALSRVTGRGDDRMGGGHLPRGGCPGLVRLPGLHDLRVNLPHYLRERVRFAGGLPIEFLPSTILLPAILVSWWRRVRVGAGSSPMLPPLLFYAGLCTLALLVWPGTKTRYAMPVAPAMAVMAGLAIEPLWRRRHWAAAVALATAVILFVYQVALVTVALPRLAEHVSTTRRLGAALDAAVRAAPAPVFVIDAPQSNKLFYVTWPVRTLPLADCILPAPAWVLAPWSKLGQIELLHPDLTVQECPPPYRARASCWPGSSGARTGTRRLERRPCEGELMRSRSGTGVGCRSRRSRPPVAGGSPSPLA